MVPSPATMWRSWVFIGSLVALCALVAWRTGGAPRVGEAVTSGTALFVAVLPNLLLGFALAGFIHVLVPAELVSAWMGDSVGFRGVLVGTVAGMLTPGGPFTHFPILASFLSKGASVGAICAYVAAWALLGINRIVVWELPILGPKVTLARVLSSLLVPPIVGWAGGWLYRAASR